MHTQRTIGKFKRAAFVSLLAAGFSLMGADLALAEMNTDFSNPAVGVSSDAVIASGTCIAKYAAELDDATRPAAEIGQRVAKRCSKLLSKSAGLASYLVGKPEDYAKNLKYLQVDLTTSAVERTRSAAKRTRSI